MVTLSRATSALHSQKGVFASGSLRDLVQEVLVMLQNLEGVDVSPGRRQPLQGQRAKGAKGGQRGGKGGAKGGQRGPRGQRGQRGYLFPTKASQGHLARAFIFILRHCLH